MLIGQPFTRGYKGIFQMKYGGIEAYNPIENRTEYYFIGIIDILQRYRLKKKLEHFLMSLPYRSVCFAFIYL
jgi:hypothetical protein